LKTLILTEKPSVAQDFAKALKAVKKNGYFENDRYYITYALGHLFEIDDSIANPKWNLDELPIIPERFKYKLKNGGQFKVIKELLGKSDKVVIATDAGREGELIARIILQQAGWKNWDKTYRFWTSSALTEEVVLEGLRNLKPAKEFDSLYYSALARQHSDWIVGINLTRAVSLKASKGVWSVGRVQTPTLALIVDRDLEIENFKPQEYYVIKGLFNKKQDYEGMLIVKKVSEGKREEEEEDNGSEDDLSGRLNRQQAEKILEELKGEKTGKVEKVIKKKEYQYSPPLYSLTTLQRDANREYGFSAQDTLSIAQRLYETYKCISYPRTDSEYLSSSNINLVKEVLKVLKREDLIGSVEKVGKRVFDDSKLTDHHAIIPLRPIPEEANVNERKLYELILKRFLAVFYPPFEYERTQVYTKVKNYWFYSTGLKVIKLGFRELYGKPSDKILPDLKEGDIVDVKKLEYERRFTKPPARYTEGSLIKKMEKLGLGTPATRASIIESLKQRGYVVLNKKHLYSTGKGRELISKLRSYDTNLKVEMTSKWEQELEGIYKKKLSYKGYQNFLEGVKLMTADEIEKIKMQSFKVVESEVKKRNGYITRNRRRSFKKG
jgi:DNA topoisomerase-3